MCGPPERLPAFDARTFLVSCMPRSRTLKDNTVYKAVGNSTLIKISTIKLHRYIT
jgi:hypothetical protein